MVVIAVYLRVSLFLYSRYKSGIFIFDDSIFDDIICSVNTSFKFITPLYVVKTDC